jgi:hypothetical protein
MRCMACGDKMRLIRIAADHGMAVPGFERHTLKCSGCQETEERLVFNRPAAKIEAFHEAPPLATENEPGSKDGEALLRQAMEMVRGPARRGARSARRRTVAGLRGKPDGGE